MIGAPETSEIYILYALLCSWRSLEMKKERGKKKEKGDKLTTWVKGKTSDFSIVLKEKKSWNGFPYEKQTLYTDSQQDSKKTERQLK